MVVADHLLLLMLHALHFFLESLDLLLKLPSKRFQLSLHLRLLWRHGIILKLTIAIHLRISIRADIRCLIEVYWAMIYLYFSTLLFLHIPRDIQLIVVTVLIPTLVVSIIIECCLLMFKILILLLLLLLLLLVLVVFIVVIFMVLILIRGVLFLLLLLHRRRRFIRVYLSLVSFLQLLKLLLDPHLFFLILFKLFLFFIFLSLSFFLNLDHQFRFVLILLYLIPLRRA